MMGGFGMMAGLGWLGYLTMIVFWIGMLLLIVWAVSALFPANRRNLGPDALELLRQRFARGELSRDEFEQARSILKA